MISPSDSPEGRAARASELALAGERELRDGRLAQAITRFREATALAPDSAEHWLRLGRAQAAAARLSVAESSLRRACALGPGRADIAIALADLLLQQNRADSALEVCRQAVAAAPDDIHAAVAEALLLPPIYADRDDLEAWRRRFVGGLQSLRARESRWHEKPHGVFGVETTNFYLAYQGGDDLALQSGYSDFLAELLARAAPELQAPATSDALPDPVGSPVVESQGFHDQRLLRKLDHRPASRTLRNHYDSLRRHSRFANRAARASERRIRLGPR